MSSSNKTQGIGLNQWISSDKPTFSDFNSDNEKIDSAFLQHVNNTNYHVSDLDRFRWNEGAYVNIFFGNGVMERTIQTECPFDPKAVFVIGCDTHCCSQQDYSRKHYFGVTTDLGGSLGLALNSSERSFFVTNNDIGDIPPDYQSFNEAGILYVYIMLR